MEVEENDLLGQMLHEVLEKDPRMAMQMMMAAIKLPILSEYVNEHKDELDKTISIDMKTREALFLFGDIAELNVTFEKVSNIHEKMESGNICMVDMNDMINREFQ